MAHTQIKMYGTLWCGDCKRAKKFFGEQRVHYEFIDVDTDLRKPGEVVQPLRHPGLPAHPAALDHRRVHPLPRRVEGRGQPGRAAPHHDQVIELVFRRRTSGGSS